MAKVLMIYGHTRKDSFAHSLGLAYAKSSKGQGNEIKETYLNELHLEDFLKYPHQAENNSKMVYPSDLQDLHKDLLWADRLIFVFPTWWGLPPALVKLYVEVVFAPKIAFRYLPVKYGMNRWEKLLKGKTARLLVTMDSPTWYYKFLTKNAIGNSFKNNILGFCGVKTLGINYFGSVKVSTKEVREKWLVKAARLGERD